MPQIGQAPGPIWTISGCMGQVYSVAGGWWLVAGEVLAVVASAFRRTSGWAVRLKPDATFMPGLGATFLRNDSGFAVNRLRQPVPQK